MEKIKNIPSRPGVYIMKDREGQVIYIGKAKDLKKRVSSYFQKRFIERKTEALVSRIDAIETIITDNEIEALILESTLIKKHRPKFNIELKDNYKYPYIKITKDIFPQLMKTRIKKDDGSLYFGPYPNVKYINRTLKTITDIFPIRRCGRKFEAGKVTSPCINYYMGKCICPLSGKIGSAEYRNLVDQVVLFLKGQNTQLLSQIKREMEQEAEKRNYEKAIYLRERFTALKKILEDQKVSTEGGEDQDIFGISNIRDTSNVTLLIKRGGKLVGKRDFLVTNPSGEEDVLGRFLALYYAGSSEPVLENRQPSQAEFPDEVPVASPKEIILPFRVEGMLTLKSFFQQRYGKSVSLCIPQKGMKKRLVDLANKNAVQKIKEQLFRYNPQSSLVELKNVLGLSRIPRLIEGFDVATLLGSFSVASMVRFRDALPDKKSYRRFKIRFVSEQNDVEMLKEAVARRYQRLVNEKKKLPDMILVDGGKPQVNAVNGVLEDLGLSDIPLIGLAKQQEEIFPHGERDPIVMEKRSDALRLLMAIRNEAHRFANTYHVKIRGKEAIFSKLKEIPGIGNALLEKILSSGVPLNGDVSHEALKKIEGIGEKRAQQITRLLREMKRNPGEK